MMLPSPLLVDAPDLRPDRAIADAVLGSHPRDVVLALMPALWGAEELVLRLGERAPLYRLHDATAGIPPGHPTGGLLVLDEPAGQDPSALEALIASAAQARHRLVIPLRSDLDVPTPVRAHGGTGRVVLAGVRRLRPEEVVEAMVRHLEGPVTSSAARRVVMLSDGQPQAVRMVLERARRTGVLHAVDGAWRWRSQDQPFRWALAEGLPELLAGLDAAEHELLRVISCAWRLPESWAMGRFGVEVVDSLLAQGLISATDDTPHGPTVLAVRSGMLDLGLSTELRPAEDARLWYTAGSAVHQEAVGPAAQAGLAWWAARVGRSIPAGEALSAAEAALQRSWPRAALSILDAAAGHPDGARTAARVRSLLGLGRVREGVRHMEELVDAAQPPLTPGFAAVLREVLLLAHRLELFRPELVGPVRRRLSAALGPSATPSIDRVTVLLEEPCSAGAADPEGLGEVRQWLRELGRVREEAPRDEGVMAQLIIGTRLGLRRHPDFGRLVLSSLVDELSADGGSPDVEECARAVLQMLTMIAGWRTDTLRLELEAWRHADGDAGTALAVDDIIGAVAAMQRDRMATAAQLAVAALEAWWEDDPYGLAGFAAAVHAACASYVGPVRHRQARELLQEVTQGEGRSVTCGETGLPELRLVSEGMALIGGGPPAQEVAHQLASLGARARAAGEWAQEQQLLLLSVLSGWRPAAQAILSSSWVRSGGRARMIVLLAEAMTTDSGDRALEIAETLLDADAEFFGCSILLVRWQSRAELDVGQRARLVGAVRRAQRSAPEASWVLGAFTELALSLREHRVLTFLQEGLSTREAAAELHLSPRTVEAVVSGLLQRFSCRNRLELLQLGLVEDEPPAQDQQTAEATGRGWPLAGPPGAG
ncbi:MULTISPECIES: helix-turn-helix transcriptional regulator [Actinomycetes]|uniref:HTH luxR-type domain-containing protein n=2 Tax=Actinomycetes TaxID=1760 RepID=A0ABP6LUX8_9MICC